MENITKKYAVIAIKWSDEANRQVEYVAGTFDTFMNAKLFRDAYNEHYKATARILEYID